MFYLLCFIIACVGSQKHFDAEIVVNYCRLMEYIEKSYFFTMNNDGCNLYCIR